MTEYKNIDQIKEIPKKSLSSRILADISDYMLEGGPTDVYNGHIIYHEIIAGIESNKLKFSSFFESDENFENFSENKDFSKIMKAIVINQEIFEKRRHIFNKNYTSPRNVSKIIDEKKLDVKYTRLLSLPTIFRSIFKKELIKIIENTLNQEFQSFEKNIYISNEDSNIVLITFKGEPTAKLFGRYLDKNDLEDFESKIISKSKESIFSIFQNEEEFIDIGLDKYYPDETSRSLKFYILFVESLQAEIKIPLIGVQLYEKE